MPEDTHTSQHLQTFTPPPVPRAFQTLVCVIRFSSAFGNVFQPHVATSFRADGFPDGMSALLLRAHVTLRNAGRAQKAHADDGLAKVWQTTSVCIRRVFIFTIGFLDAVHTSAHLEKCMPSDKYTSILPHTRTHALRAVYARTLTNSLRDRVISCPHLLKQFEWVRAETKLEILH